MTDESGNVAWKADYKPFGEAYIAGNVENNFRFPGQYFDEETGMHYNWHRYYLPGTGRYISADPIGLEGGINLYAYVNGNPLSRVDPTWMDFFKGIRNGLLGLAAGVAIAGTVVLSAPASVATSFLVIASATGGFTTGRTAYEFAPQTKWLTGEQLTQDEVGTRQGQLMVDAITLGLVGTWGTKGMGNDKAFLQLSARDKWKYEVGSLPIPKKRYSEVCDIAPQDRNIKWSEYDLGVLNLTIPEGPTPLARLPILPGIIGSNQD